MNFPILALLSVTSVAFGAEPLANFDLAVKMQQERVPGVSIAIVDGGKIVWARGFGIKEIGSPERVTPRTLFQAASISKFVAAAGMLHLVEEAS